MAITERYFTAVVGTSRIVHPSFKGAHVYWVRRQGLTYKEGNPLAVGNLEFGHLGAIILFLNYFEVPEVVYVLYE